MEVVNINEIKNIKFDANLANKKCYTLVNYEGEGEKKEYIGILTGRYGLDSVYNGQVLESNLNGKIQWLANVTGGLYQVSDGTSQIRNKAQDVLNELLQNNNDVATNILIGSLFVSKLESKGYNVDVYKGQIKGLYNRLNERNKKIIDSGYVDSIKKESVSQIDNTLSNSIKGVGLVLTTGIVIAITASVVAVMASLAWYIFYSLNMESRNDVSKSKELNKILAKVDPKTKEEVIEFCQEYGDNRYKDGARKVKMELLWDNVKKYGLIAGGVALFFYVNNKGLLNNKKNK